MPLTGPGGAFSRDGFIFVKADDFRGALAREGSLADWTDFIASWHNLEPDDHMADQGRYRKRRHAVFEVSGRGIQRAPHQPHYQGLEYNALNGGIERWFAPVEVEIGASASLRTILTFCTKFFDEAASRILQWHVEIHQFRIEARTGEAGQPTPEGMHRDGVDYVLVLLIARENIASGTTVIHDADHRVVGNFTLTHSFDAALVDDHRVFHGVTAVTPLDPARISYRDVLVVTFRAATD